MDTAENRALIVKLLSDNVDVLYDKDKNRIWKIIEHQLQVSSKITFGWKGIRNMFKSSILCNLEQFQLPQELIKQIRFPFLEEYHGIQLSFEDKPCDRSSRMSPMQLQRAKFYVQYKLSKKYSEHIYENISSIVRGISCCVININHPMLGYLSSKDRIALKKFCIKTTKPIKRDHPQVNTRLSSQWISKRKQNEGESENLAFQPPKKVARTVLGKKENKPCDDDDILILSSDADDEGTPAVNKTIEDKKDTMSIVNLETARSQVLISSLPTKPISQVQDENMSKPADLSEVLIIHNKKGNIIKSAVRASEEKTNLLERDVAVSCDIIAKSENESTEKLKKACATECKVVFIKADVLPSGAVEDNDQKVFKMLENICLNTPRFRLYVDPDRMQHYNSITSSFDYDAESLIH